MRYAHLVSVGTANGIPAEFTSTGSSEISDHRKLRTSEVGVGYTRATYAIESGMKLGPYEILGPLGAGGMGEVIARGTRGWGAMWR